ncbi:MAG: flagellar basal body L-ring protein FlgH [Phycisphaeraceae bacterium]|nr:flagellar basal body L-ring protein FlgH [Phycisphaeraceae bacterium]
MTSKPIIATCAALVVLSTAADAQLSRRPNPAPTAADPAEPLYGLSLFAVRPPEPRTLQRHDLVTIIVNESSTMKSEQSLETTKSTDASARLGAVLSIDDLLDLRLRGNANISNLELLRYAAQRNFAGDGEYERKDRITDRITATVIDVKPNGVIVLEARRYTATDDESKTFILSGLCRTEDVTQQNTIQSNQLADLRLEVRHEGNIRQSASKGPLTRFMEWILPF